MSNTIIISPQVSLLIIQNLAVADLLYMTTSVPTAVVSNIANRWVLGDFLCGFTAYFSFLPAGCNLILVALLSANKLYRCLFPLRTLSIRTFHGVLVCGVAWFLSTLLFIELLILKRGYKFYIPINRCSITYYRDSADYWKILEFINATIYVAVPILTLTISNIWLLFIVFRKHLLQRSTILMVLTVSAVFWLSWVWVLVFQVVPLNSRTIWLIRMRQYMIFFTNWGNPILYILTNESFKQYAKSINPFKFCCAQEVPNGPRKIQEVFTITNALTSNTTLNTSIRLEAVNQQISIA